VNKMHANILIVEDNPTNIDVVFSYLDEAGFDISVATSGESALQQCLLTQPDVVLLDVMMSGIDGFETCRRLKANPETADIPVIFMTALADTKDKVQGFVVGAVDYITKPIQHEELLARLMTHLKIRQLQKQTENQNTELQKVMKQVRQSKQLLTAVIDATPDWIFALDKENYFILANKEIANAFNLSPQTMVGKSPVELGLSAIQIWGDAEHGSQGLQTDNELVLAGQALHNPQQLMVLTDNSSRIFDTYKLPLRDKTGEVFAVLAISRDITLQKRAEEIYQKQAELQRAILDNAGYAIISTDTEGLIQVFNPTAEKMLGYKAEDIIGKVTPALWHDGEEVVKRAEQLSIELGVKIEPCFEVFVTKSRLNLLNEYEWTYIDKHGARFPVLLTITALRDATGTIFGFLGLASDITERRKLQHEVEAYQYHLEKLVDDRTQRLEIIAQLSKQLTAILDLQKLLELLVNQLKEGLGYYHVHVYLRDDDSDTLVMVAGSGEVGQILKNRQHQLKLKQGIVGQVAASNEPFLSNNVDEVAHFFRNPLLPDTLSELAVPLHIMGQVIGVLDIQSNHLNAFTATDVFMMQSIADQAAIAVQNARLLSDRQATIAKLQVVDRAKSQFITMMSHELRTPLHAINGFSELLLMGLSGDLLPQVQEDVQLIYNNGQHLLALINDVLDVSQIESGQLQLTPQPINVKELVTRVLETANMLIKDRSLQVLVDVPETLPIIQADPTRLHQVLLNLVSNAVKFTPQGSIKIQVKHQDHEIYFSVIDTGIGIANNKLQAIFEAFQQADMSDARRYGGTGLGLTISQKLVQLHGGKMSVKSQEGVGSQFTFTLPLVSEV